MLCKARRVNALTKRHFPTEIEHTLLIDKPLPTQPPQKPEEKV